MVNESADPRGADASRLCGCLAALPPGPHSYAARYVDLGGLADGYSSVERWNR